MSAAASVRAAVALGFVVISFSVQADEAPLQTKAQPKAETSQNASPLKPVVERIFAQFGGAVVGDPADCQPEPPVIIQVAAPLSVKAAKAWEKLGQSIHFNFPQETPLEEVLKYLKQATSDEQKKEKGLSIYVDPIGLQEAEKTMTSTVILDLDDLPVSLGLTLALRQLGLKFYVDPHGIVMIVNENEEAHSTDPSARILEELAVLRGQLQTIRSAHGMPQPDLATRALAREVAALKEQVAELQGVIKGLTERNASPRAAAPPERGRSQALPPAVESNAPPRAAAPPAIPGTR